MSIFRLKMTAIIKFIATLCVTASLLLLGSNNVFAAGTLANTPISNSATLAYAISGIAQTNITTAAVTFLVDNKVNLDVKEASGSPTIVSAGLLQAVTTFTITNLGNAVQDYVLTGGNIIGAATVFGSPDTFDALACNTFVETNGVAAYQAAVDIATFIDELAPDASKDVYVVCNIPAAIPTSQQAVTELTAVTRAGGLAGLGAAITQTVGVNNPAAVDIVFADAATLANGLGTAPAQIPSDATAFARDAYRVVTVATNVNKTAACQLTPTGTSTTANCSQAKTGTMISYQIKVDVTGSGSADKLFITDPIPSDLIYTPNSIAIGASPRTDVIDADNVQFTTVALPAILLTQQPAVPANTAIINLGNVIVTPVTPKTFVITLKATIK